MGIDLSRLNISLDTFNAQAKGDYNIGQMKLSEDGTSVYRTNKHKTLTFLNTTTISREEALAVKDAFCRALSNEGLSDEQVENVRTKLGISGSKVDILKAGNIKPLTAAEVREVIDTYADKLNANRTGDTMLETSAEIYRGVSQKTMDKRAEKRKEVNDETLEAMSSVSNSEVNSLMDLLEGGEGGESFALSSKGIARELVRELSKESTLSYSGAKLELTTSTSMVLECNSDCTITAHVTLEGGNTFTIDTGRDKEDLLETILAFLRKAGESEEVKVVDKAAEEKAIAKSALRDVERSIEYFTNDTQMDYALRNHQFSKQKMASFKARKASADEIENAARSEVRDQIMKPAVESLQKALTRIRGLDNRNVELVNELRNVFYLSGPKVNINNLLERIKDALGLTSKASAHAPAPEDDDMETLNINKLMGR